MAAIGAAKKPLSRPLKAVSPRALFVIGTGRIIAKVIAGVFGNHYLLAEDDRDN